MEGARFTCGQDLGQRRAGSRNPPRKRPISSESKSWKKAGRGRGREEFSLGSGGTQPGPLGLSQAAERGL